MQTKRTSHCRELWTLSCGEKLILGKNFWHEVTFLSKMDEMMSKIKKIFYNPPTVLSPLFISEKKKFFFHQHPDPYSSWRFGHFWHVSEISAVRPLWGAWRWLLSVSEKKNVFVLNTLRTYVLKTKTRIWNGWLEKKNI